MVKVWVLTVEQYYANSYSVVGVYSTKEKAEDEAKRHPDTRIESYEVDCTN